MRGRGHAVTLMLKTHSLISIKNVASMRVRADGLIVSAALTDDSRFIVKALLERDKTKTETYF